MANQLQSIAATSGGAAIGSIFGPIGTAVGGLLGAVFGGKPHGPKKSEIAIQNASTNISQFSQVADQVITPVVNANANYAEAVQGVLKDEEFATVLSIIGAIGVLILVSK